MIIGTECPSRKRMFPTKESVKDYITENTAKHLRYGIRKLYYYLCPVCGMYHLTKQKQVLTPNKTKQHESKRQNPGKN